MDVSTDTIHVLHVDDEPDFADMAATFLEREDNRFTVRTATSATQGLDLLADHDVDCIVSDYDMPRTNGIEFLESVRENCPDLPFILYTGKGSEEVASDAISAGVTDYLQKERGTDQYAILANRIQNVVEQTRARRERERMRERMELMLAHTDSVIFEINLDTERVIRYGAFDRFFGLTPDVVPTWKDHLDQAVHPADQGQFQQFYQRLIDGDLTDGTLEYRTHPDRGPVRWIKDTVSVEPEPADDTHLAIGIAQEITEYKKREQELQWKEHRYQALFNDPNILVGLLDTDGTVRDINQTAMEYVDTTIDELTGEPFWKTPWFTHSNSLQQEVKSWIDRAASGEYVEFEADLVRPDGDPYVVEGVFRPVTNDEGDVVSLLISDRDITDRKEHEQELERIRDFFREAEQLGNLGAWEFDATGESVWTEGTRRIYDIDEDFDPTVEGGIEFYHPEDRNTVRDAVERAVEHGESYDIQVRLITAAGAERWVRTRGEPIDESDGPTTVRGYIQDITTQKERERELERYERLIETLPIGYGRTTLDGDLLATNSTFVAMVDGDSAEDVLSRNVETFYQDPTTRERFLTTLREEGQVRDEEVKVTTLTGETIWVSITARVLEDDGENYIDALVQDITERKAREQELERQNERLDEFASIVSHDLRNPLNVVQGRVELAQRDCDSTHLAAAASAVDRSLALIDDLLTLAREGEQANDIEAVDLQEIGKRCWQTVEESDATLDIQTRRTLRANPGRLQQLLENLMVNAIEHSGASVHVTLGELADGFYVEDDGPGIPEDEREQVFDPGYTTTDEGTGFGLNIVRVIVDVHDWDVRVTEGSDGGARFEITGVQFAAE